MLLVIALSVLELEPKRLPLGVLLLLVVPPFVLELVAERIPSTRISGVDDGLKVFERCANGVEGTEYFPNGSDA